MQNFAQFAGYKYGLTSHTFGHFGDGGVNAFIYDVTYLESYLTSAESEIRM